MSPRAVSRRPLPVAVSAGVALGVALLPLAPPAAGAAPASRAGVSAAAPIGTVRATATSGLVSRVAVVSSVRTAYRGRYAAFDATFRCPRGRLFQLACAVTQQRPTAVASSQDDPRTGVCTGSLQRRVVYVVINRPEGQAAPVPLHTGRGQATAVLVTAATPSSRPRLDAASLATVQVAPR